MSVEEYDPLFPTEDDECVFVSESRSAVPQKGDVKPSAVSQKEDVKPKSAEKVPPVPISCSVVDIPDLNAIPLPEDIVCSSKAASARVTKTVIDTKPPPPCSEPVPPEPVLPKPLEATPRPQPNLEQRDSPDLHKQTDGCQEAATKSPLSKIQLLIKQKAEQLKGSAVSPSKPTKARNLSLSFGIGKTKVRPTDKVKFSVIKIDKKVAVFNRDSDDEEPAKRTLLSKSPTNSRLPPSPILSAVKPLESKASFVSGKLPVDNHAKDQGIGEHSSKSSPSSNTGVPVGKTVASPTKSKVLISSPTKPKPSIPSLAKSKVSEFKSHPIPDVKIAAQLLVKKRELEPKLSLDTPISTDTLKPNVTRHSKKDTVSALQDADNASALQDTDYAPALQDADNASALQDANTEQVHVTPIQPAQVQDEPEMKVGPTKAPVIPAVLTSSTDMKVSPVFSRLPRLSYEADSTIPDEAAVTALTKLVELYSDEESLSDHESSSVQSATCPTLEHAAPAPRQASTSVPQPSVSESDTVTSGSDSSFKMAGDHVTTTDAVVPSVSSEHSCISQSDVVDSLDVKHESMSKEEGIRNESEDITPQPVLPPEQLPQPVPPPMSTQAYVSDKVPAATKTPLATKTLLSTKEPVSTKVHVSTKEPVFSKVPVSTKAPFTSDVLVTPDVQELTAVAQQLFQALSERIKPAVTVSKPEEKPKTLKVSSEADVSSSRSRQRKCSESNVKKSPSRSTSKELSSRVPSSFSRSRRSRSRDRHSKSRVHRSRSKDRRPRSGETHSSRKHRRSRSRTRYRDSSRSRHRSRSLSRSRSSRKRVTVSPEYRERERRTSVSREGTNSSNYEKRKHSKMDVASAQESSAERDKPSSLITNQVIADNLALISSSSQQSTVSPTVLQYVYTADGQLCQIASQLPQNWARAQPAITTQVIEGPPPPPPGLGPPPPPRVAPPRPRMATVSTPAESGLAPPASLNLVPTPVLPGPPPAPPAPYPGLGVPGYFNQPTFNPYLSAPQQMEPSNYIRGPPYEGPPQPPQWNKPVSGLVPPAPPTIAHNEPHMQPQSQAFLPKQRGPPPPPPGFKNFEANIRPRPRHPSTFTRPYRASRWSSAPPVAAEMMDIVDDANDQSTDVRRSPTLVVNKSENFVQPNDIRGSCPDPSPTPASVFDTITKYASDSKAVTSEPVISSSDVPSTVTPSSSTQLGVPSKPAASPSPKQAAESEEAGSRRRSSRIKSLEIRTQAENKLKADKEQLFQEAKKKKIVEKTSKPDEEVVDFVIDNRSSKKTIDLPDRSESHTSPTKTHPPSTASAPGKLKMRWLQASKWQQENVSTSPTSTMRPDSTEPEFAKDDSVPQSPVTDENTKPAAQGSSETAKSKEPAYFERIDDNIYLTTSKKNSKSQKEAKGMVCDCSTSEEEIANGVQACGEDCLNRMLMIECSSRCPCGEFCTNKRFERHANADVEIFLTENKGHGLRAKGLLPKGSFIREYVGEVLGCKDFKHRVKQYARDHLKHYYFMALNAEEVIDATSKGNISRFINHSCDSNAETQKWTVNGRLRIGFFTTNDIEEDEEITFDYQFERYGKEAQKCYCGSTNCRGFIGGEKTQPMKQLLDTKHTPSPSSKKKKEEAKKKLDYNFSDDMLSAEIEKLASLGGLKKSDHVLRLSRLMVRAESVEHRTNLVDIILDTSNQNCLRLFLSYHGLSLLWIWMVDLPSAGCCELKLMIINVLKRLPISNKNLILETKVLQAIERMAKESKEHLDTLNVELELKKEEKLSVKAEPVDTQVAQSSHITQSAQVDIKTEPAASPAIDSIKTEPRVETDCKPDHIVGGQGDGDTAKQCDLAVAQVSLTAGGDAHLGSGDGKVETTETPQEQSETVTQSQLAADGSRLHRQSSNPTDEDSQDECMSQDEPGTDDMSKTEVETQVEDLTHLVAMLDELLNEWSLLKESFKIPKKQENEERKRTVHEIDTSKHEEVDGKKERLKYGGKYERKRKRDLSPDLKSTKRKDDPSTQQDLVQSQISKMERRRMFEEQVRAEEELLAYEQQQNERYQQHQYLEDAMEHSSQQQHQQQQPEGDAFHSVFPHQHPTVPIAGYAPPLPQQQSLGQQSIGQQAYQSIQFNPPQPMPSGQPLQQMGYIQPAVTPVQPTVAAPVVQTSVPMTSQAQTVCYYTTPQGVVLQQIVQTTAPQPQNPSLIYMTTATSQQDNPPPPPIDLTPKLHPDWKTASDAEGRIYYYHKVTRQTQWEVPTGYEVIEPIVHAESPSHSKKSKSRHKKTTMAPADTSADAKKIKEHFKSAISVHIRTLLNGYMKLDCKVGKITNKDDYKFLAKKLTHAVLDKELKHCRHHEDLEVNENVKFKAKEYVKKYMAKSGSVYKRDKDDK